MSGITIDETLNALKSARLGSSRFKQAEQEIIRLAELADQKNQPERDRKRSEAAAACRQDWTPTWQSVVKDFVCGIRNKRNDRTLVDKMVADLRKMATYAESAAAAVNAVDMFQRSLFDE